MVPTTMRLRTNAARRAAVAPAARGAQVVAFARTQVVAFREGDDKKDDDDDGDVSDPSGGLADQRRYDW